MPQQEEKGRLLIVHFLPYAWHLLGGIIPIGWYRTPWAKKRVSEEFVSLKNLSNVHSHPNFKLRFAPDFKVVSVEKITVQQMAIRMASFGLDPFMHREYMEEAGGGFGFKKLRLINTSYQTSVDLYIKRYPPHEKKFHDIVEGDDVSLLFSGEWPVFIYNQSAHVLMNCDIWDFQILRTKMVMHDKGTRIAKQATQMVAAVIKSGKSLDLSRPNRLAFYKRSYDELPPVKGSFFREFNEVLFLVCAVGFLLFVLSGLIRAYVL